VALYKAAIPPIIKDFKSENYISSVKYTQSTILKNMVNLKTGRLLTKNDTY